MNGRRKAQVTNAKAPVIYDDPMGRQWLEHGYGLWLPSKRPWPAEFMEAHDVSTLVNTPENDTPECIKPLPPGYLPRGQTPLI
jgi:putative SOS response-associated peptidase YedK